MITTQSLLKPFLLKSSAALRKLTGQKQLPLKCCSTYLSTCLLKSRTLIRVSGRDSNKLLQGLITNDMMELQGSQSSSIYSMLLNAQGRCMFDTLLYKLDNSKEEYMVEVDSSVTDTVIKHMKLYKLRSKVSFEDCSSYKVYAMFMDNKTLISKEDILSSFNHEDAFVFTDPRTDLMGLRLIVKQNGAGESALIDNYQLTDSNEYTNHRLALGVSEGHAEVHGVMPLELNLALLNGVSFNKGCYIGQELVARTHHTGVIRKRIMPLKVLSANTGNEHVQLGAAIRSNKNKRIGKLIAMNDNCGLGLMRLQETLKESSPLNIEGIVELNATKPEWWPDDLQFK